MSRTRFLWWILAAAMAGSLFYYSWMKLSVRPEQTVPPSIHGHAPDFTLKDTQGKPFGSSMLRGTVWVADFIFTSCAGQCPQMTNRMRLLQERLPQSVQLVSITVDPERDTPSVLARYASEYGAQPGRWHFLTGDKTAIQHLTMEGFHLGYADGGPKEEPIIHSVRFILVDQQGEIRGYYDAADQASLDRLVQDAKDAVRGSTSSPRTTGHPELVEG